MHHHHYKINYHKIYIFIYTYINLEDNLEINKICS